MESTLLNQNIYGDHITNKRDPAFSTEVEEEQVAAPRDSATTLDAVEALVRKSDVFSYPS